MTITNHLLAGSVIALTVSQPVLAIGLAFISHFVMDALPHFGYPGRKGYSEVLKHRLTYVVAAMTLATSLVIAASLLVTGHWFALLVGLIAASPDLVGLYNYLVFDKREIPSRGFLASSFHVNFHRKIQWCERPWGIGVEVLTTAALGVALFYLI